MYKFLPVKALEHLNDEQKKSLIEDFFAQDVGLSMVKLSKYGLSHYRTGLLPIIEIDLQESCINCGSTISRYKFITRTKFKNDNLPPFCFEDKDVLRMFLQPNNCDCGHLYNSNWCKCEACRIERDERDFILKEQARKKEKYESNWKKKIIKKKYDIEIACVPFGEIEHPSSKVLAFFLSEFVNKDTDLISLNSEDKIFPVNFFNENIDRLLDERILKISHLSEIDSFEFKNGEITGVYIYKVFYEFNVANISISCKKEDIRIGSMDLLNEIKLYECLEYFDYQSERINLVFEHSKKLISVIKELILIFEVEQIYSLMYSSCKQITYKMATEKIVKTYAYNLWICFLEKMGKNAFENSWNVKAYERPFDCRKSMIRTYVDFLVGKCERERQKSDRYKEKKVDQES